MMYITTILYVFAEARNFLESESLGGPFLKITKLGSCLSYQAINLSKRTNIHNE